jgi:hypothetical protein
MRFGGDSGRVAGEQRVLNLGYLLVLYADAAQNKRRLNFRIDGRHLSTSTVSKKRGSVCALPAALHQTAVGAILQLRLSLNKLLSSFQLDGHSVSAIRSVMLRVGTFQRPDGVTVPMDVWRMVVVDLR